MLTDKDGIYLFFHDIINISKIGNYNRLILYIHEFKYINKYEWVYVYMKRK